MKETIKCYNFNKLNLKVENLLVEKNNLSIETFYNLKTENSKIEVNGGFEIYFKNLFSESLFESFKNSYENILKTTIFITDFEYYSALEQETNYIYFLITNEYKLFKLIISNETFNLTNLNIQFNSLPNVFKDDDKIYFYEGNKFIYFNDDLFITVSDFCGLETYLNYQNKTFFVTNNDKFTIYFTDKTGIENLSDNLSLYDSVKVNSSDGEIIKLVTFKNNLYVIQQYAITRLILSGDSPYFYSNCFVRSKIYQNSIGELNDYLIYYSSSGMYLFDGNEIKQIFNQFQEKLIYDEKFKSFVYNNKYYIFCKTNIGESKENVLFEFNIHNDFASTYYISNIQNVFVVQSRLKYDLILLTFNGQNYELVSMSGRFSNDSKKYIKFNKICFDDNISKSIVGIKTISKGEFIIKISNENVERIFEVNGNLNISAFGISGYAFDIEIYSDVDFEINSILFQVQSITEQI